MLNNITLMGRLTADTELRQTQSGTATTRFTVAVDRDFTPQGQERQADFITVVAWKQTAEFINKYFSKGSMIAIVGSLRTGSYADKKYPDVKHYTTEVYADKVSFCGGKSDNVAPKSEKEPTKQDVSVMPGNLSDFEEIVGDDDLPF